MTDSINNGGLAFPSQIVNYSDETVTMLGQDVPAGQMLVEHGMTLRDYFAAKAMALIEPRDYYIHGGDAPWESFADACYELSDAMLKARQS